MFRWLFLVETIKYLVEKNMSSKQKKYIFSVLFYFFAYLLINYLFGEKLNIMPVIIQSLTWALIFHWFDLFLDKSANNKKGKT